MHVDNVKIVLEQPGEYVGQRIHVPESGVGVKGMDKEVIYRLRNVMVSYVG